MGAWSRQHAAAMGTLLWSSTSDPARTRFLLVLTDDKPTLASDRRARLVFARRWCTGTPVALLISAQNAIVS